MFESSLISYLEMIKTIERLKTNEGKLLEFDEAKKLALQAANQPPSEEK